MANALRERFPAAAWIDPSAAVYGDVEIGEGASLWPGAVIRAESLSVKVGRFVNLQDHVMVHIGYNTATSIGDYASITHRVVLHGCAIGENCLIGIGATIMDGAVIGANSIVAGHTFVREGQVIANRLNAWLYHRNALAYAKGDHRAWTGPAYEAARDAERARLEVLHAAGKAD